MIFKVRPEGRVGIIQARDEQREHQWKMEAGKKVFRRSKGQDLVSSGMWGGGKSK